MSKKRLFLAVLPLFLALHTQADETQKRAEYLGEELVVKPVENSLGKSEFEGVKALYKLHSQQAGVEDLLTLFEKSQNAVYLQEGLRIAFEKEREKLPKMIDLALKHLFSDAYSLRILCAVAEQNGNKTLGLKAARQLVKIEPQNALSYTIYSVFLPPKEATLQLQKAYKLDPNADTLVRLSENYKLNGKYDEAIWLLKKAANDTKLNANHTNLKTYLAHFLILNREFFAAQEIFEELFKENGDKAVLNTAVDMWLAANELKKAANLCEKYAILDEKTAGIYAKMGDLPRAIEILRELQNSAQPKQKARFASQEAIYSFELIEKNGDTQVGGVEVNLARVLTLFDTSVLVADEAVFYNYFGYLLIDFDINIELGLNLCLKANQLDGDSTYILDSVAWGYFKLGREEEAKLWFNRVLNDTEFMKTKEAKAHKAAIYREGILQKSNLKREK